MHADPTEATRQDLLRQHRSLLREHLKKHARTDGGFIVHPTLMSYTRTGRPHFYYLHPNQIDQFTRRNLSPPMGSGEYRDFYYFSADEVINHGKTLETIW